MGKGFLQLRGYLELEKSMAPWPLTWWFGKGLSLQVRVLMHPKEAKGALRLCFQKRQEECRQLGPGPPKPVSGEL